MRRSSGEHFVLRETYRDGGVWRHRDLIDLGRNPFECIYYPKQMNGYAFYFSTKIQEALDRKGVDYRVADLEEAFFPFLDARIQYVLERYRHFHASPYNISKACHREEIPNYQRELHSFDVRRLHYLKFGRMDMGQLEGREWKFLKVLSCKSRDEIEATIELMEQALPHREHASYVYTSLHLQTHFPNSIMKNQPIALDPDKVDEIFLEVICKLNADDSFFRGVENREEAYLHPYLRKYVAMHFDGTFEPENTWSEILIDSMRRRAFYNHAPGKTAIGLEEALKVLDLSEEEFKRIKKGELTRRYRRMAKKIHPDQGGDHETFVQLNRAYELLISKKQ